MRRQLPFRIVMRPLAKGVSYHVAAANTLEEISEDWAQMEKLFLTQAKSLDNAQDQEEFLLVKIKSLASATTPGAPHASGSTRAGAPLMLTET